MIKGIGVDLVEIHRVVHACEREHFLHKIFTEEEIAQMDDGHRRAASDFAGKEAVVKILGTGFSGVEASEIAILRDERGAPYVMLYGRAKERAFEMGIRKIHISISNTSDQVMAFAVGTDEECGVEW